MFCWVLFQVSASGQSPDQQSITYFLIDGLSNENFRKMRGEGRLSTIDSLAKNGLYVENGIGSFPSMTGYSYYPFLTGVDATESGILGLRWFDRTLTEGNLRNYVGRSNVYMNEDIRDDVKTIYEYFPDRYTATINSYCNRGVQESIKTGWAHTTAKYSANDLFGQLKKLPLIGNKIYKDHFQHEADVLEKSIDQLKRNPVAHWITFASPDASNHVLGTTDQYFDLLEYIDIAISRYINEANALGQNRIYAIISDHGIQDVFHNIRIEEYLLEQTGIRLKRGKATSLWKMKLDEPIEELSDYDGHLVINGNLSAYVYMKNLDGNWNQQLEGTALENYRLENSTINLPKILAHNKGVDFVIYGVDEHTVRVVNKDGYADIGLQGDSLTYLVHSSNPFNYNILELLSVEKCHFNDCLTITINSDYPDAMYRLSKLFKADQAPDMVIVSAKGYDLAKDYEIFVGNYKGGHGGLHKDLLNVPFILSGPDIQPQVIKAMRSEDLGKIILQKILK